MFKEKTSNFDEKFVNTANIDEIIQIVRFKINSNKYIKIEYEFKDWQYVTTLIALNKNEKLEFDCLDTETKTTLSDTKYFKNKIEDVSIRIMITSITVRNLEIVKHFIDKYVCCFMYFSETNEND